ncbi:MAG: NADPH:quinone reductase [Candidatus Binataceae bacterium]
MKTRAGAPGRVAGFPKIIPHSDGAGIIDRVGDGISESRIEERVWTWNAQWQRPFGTAAELVAVPAAQAVALPEGTDFDAGACFGIPALSAHYAVTSDDPVEDKFVLITGGAGAVGHYAIQFAKAQRARAIIATVSSEQKAQQARGAGARTTINYKTEDVAARVKAETDGRGVDRIIEVDLGSNLALIESCLKPGGTVVIYGSASDMEPRMPVLNLGKKGAVLRFMSVYTIPMTVRVKAIAELTRRLNDGYLKHRIAARFPLDKIADAHEAVESGKYIGNVVLEIASSRS